MRNPEVELIGGPCSFRDHAKIRIVGSKKDVEKAEAAVKAIPNLENIPESEARLTLQELVEQQNLKATILFDGNSIWNSKPILVNLRRIMEQGTLYNGAKPDYVAVGSMLRFPVVGECILSDYFYQFLSLHCGSIAHYNKQGWVTTYPTVEDFKAFFKKNEYGKRVLDDVPWWATDIRRIVELIENMLFPLEAIRKERMRQPEPKPTQYAGQSEIIVPTVIISNMLPPPKPRFSLAAHAKEKANAKS